MKKSLRFSIFERDCFTCQYCGRKPPHVILHVDHIISRYDGGGDEEQNLLTACKDCNLGKSKKSVDKATLGKSFKAEIQELEDRQAQLSAYYEFVKRKQELKCGETDVFQRCWEDCSDGTQTLTDNGLKNIRNLLTRYDAEMIFKAMRIAWDATHVHLDNKFQYMCGVLKNLKAQLDDPDYPNKHGK